MENEPYQSPPPPGEVFTATIQQRGQPVKVHAICTGRVAMPTAFRHARSKGLLRLNLLLDQDFTEYMPVWVWVIEHAEGILVIDTGENCDVADPHYFDRVGVFDRYVSRRLFRFSVRREEEIDQQLVRIGIPINQVRRVILTHLHLDHTDGLRHFEKTEILVARSEMMHPYNNLPQLYPRWFKPCLADYEPERIAGFAQAIPVTDRGDVWLVSTPGHTYHHNSVLLMGDTTHYLFAGDMSYTQEQLLRGELAGANADQHQARQSYQKVLAYARQHPLVYLPSHDADAGRRLCDHKVLLP